MRIKQAVAVCLASLVFVFYGSLPAFAESEHAQWDALLKAHVSEGKVDYAALKKMRTELISYLGSLSGVHLQELSRNEQLAFLINAYNASVVRTVIDHYPIKSVKDVDHFFDGAYYAVNGYVVTLDELEEKIHAYGEPRVNFALVCAARSCPDLRSEAYTGAALEAQLADQTRRFLADEARGLQLKGRKLYISKIFKWHKEDFQDAEGDFGSDVLIETFGDSVPQPIREAAAEGKLRLKNMDYDWTLNGLASTE